MAKLTVVGPLFVLLVLWQDLRKRVFARTLMLMHVHRPSLFSCILQPLLVRNVHPHLVADTFISRLNIVLLVLTPLMSRSEISVLIQPRESISCRSRVPAQLPDVICIT